MFGSPFFKQTHHSRIDYWELILEVLFCLVMITRRARWKLFCWRPLPCVFLIGLVWTIRIDKLQFFSLILQFSLSPFKGYLWDVLMAAKSSLWDWSDLVSFSSSATDSWSDLRQATLSLCLSSPSVQWGKYQFFNSLVLRIHFLRAFGLGEAAVDWESGDNEFQSHLMYYDPEIPWWW